MTSEVEDPIESRLALINKVNDLVEAIYTFDSDVYTSQRNGMTQEQAETIAAQLIENWIIDRIDGVDIAELHGNLIPDEEDDD